MKTVSSSSEGRQPHAQYLERRYFPEMDGLRAFSILAVVAHHAGVGFGRPYLAVVLFFLISGFLITTLLLRERAETGRISLRTFWARRALRIFPLYYAAIAIYVVLVLLLQRDTAVGRQFFSNLPYFATCTSNWFVNLDQGSRIIFYFSWTVATEVQFYLLWPPILALTRRWLVPVAAMTALMVVSAVSRYLTHSGEVDGAAVGFRILNSISVPIGVGCLMAFGLQWKTGFDVVHRVAGRWWSGPLSLTLLAAAWPIRAIPEEVFFPLLGWLLLSTVVREGSGLQLLLANPVVLHLGKVTYGIYLLHMLMLNLARQVIGPTHIVADFVVAVIATVIVASLSYRYYERPFMRLRLRPAAKRTPTSLDEASAPGLVPTRVTSGGTGER
ncbi:MAG: acyltransferase [Deltaproteobacteria bacterium]|nr:acyltransferase [Deltaproteobacteria bacterium]